ncbi:MAG: hypothetical protein R2737_04875 [Candidatus Nanopelagicales bacterium]
MDVMLPPAPAEAHRLRRTARAARPAAVLVIASLLTAAALVGLAALTSGWA